MHEDGIAAKLALEIERNELKVMKMELDMQSHLHPTRSYSNDEEPDMIDEKWIVKRRDTLYNSQMKAKRRVANKACREQFDKRARDEKQRFFSRSG